MRLHRHHVHLQTRRLSLRSMTELDWPVLLTWNQDARVLFYTDPGNVEPYSLSKLQSLYRQISARAHMFIIEREGTPIGECWLQRMNLEEIIRSFTGQDVRRIDISLGTPELRGNGLGGEAVGALVKFAFGKTGTQVLFACDVADDNHRSRRTFEKNGFVKWEPPTRSSRSLPKPTSHFFLARRTSVFSRTLPNRSKSTGARQGREMG